MVVRVWEVLNANQNARSAYLRVLSRQTGQEVAEKVICLLLWLEMTMRVKILSNVAAMEPADTMLTQVVIEAEAVYNYLLHDHCTLPQLLELEGIPTIVALCGGDCLVDFMFFKFHKDIIARGVTVIRNTIAAFVFNDNLHAMLHRFPNPVEAPELMAPFVALTRMPREDSRTVFVAFPESHPLGLEDIKNYFERHPMFGNCIQHIAMEQPRAGQTAKHGVIVFRSRELRDQAMFKKTSGFFSVNGHDMWVQHYMPLCSARRVHC